MAGRKPKPTAVRLAEGNPGKRAINEREPKPRAKRPKAPKHLSDAALIEWRRVMRILSPMGIVTEAEADLLAVYCSAYAQWVQASEIVQRQGLIVLSGNETPMRNPALKIVDDQVRVMGRCMTELGLTPSARVRLVAPGSDVDPLDKLLDVARQKAKGIGGNG